MRNKGSKIAMHIEQEYKMKKAYERKQRKTCKEKSCEKCEFEKICEDTDGNNL